MEVEEFPLVLHQEFLTQVRLRLLRLQERRLDMAAAQVMLAQAIRVGDVAGTTPALIDEMIG